MRVKLKISRAGDRVSQVPGDVVDVPNDEAERLFAADQAEPVNGRETAMVEPREAAMHRPGKARRSQ